MLTVLGEQDVGEKLGARASARDRVRWGRRLCDCFTGPAGELLAHMLDHFPLARERSFGPLRLRPALIDFFWL